VPGFYSAARLGDNGELASFVAHNEERLVFEAGEFRAQPLGVVVHLDIHHFLGTRDDRKFDYYFFIDAKAAADALEVSFLYSALAWTSIGIFGSASFQVVKKSS
jgi:hypothetical protein